MFMQNEQAESGRGGGFGAPRGSLRTGFSRGRSWSNSSYNGGGNGSLATTARNDNNQEVASSSSTFCSNRGGNFGGSRGGFGFGQSGNQENNGFGSSGRGGRGGSFGGSRGGFSFGQSTAGNQDNNGFGSSGRGGRGGSFGGRFGQSYDVQDNSNRGGFDSGRGCNRGNDNQERYSRGNGGGFGGGDRRQDFSRHDNSGQSNGNQEGISRDGDHSHDGFAKRSKRHERVYPTAVVLPSGQMEIQPPPPVHVDITPQDKEEFGEEIEEKLVAHTVPHQYAEMGFQPVVRELDEIFNEDAKHAAEYATVMDEDDEIKIDGLDGNLSMLDNWTDAGFKESLIANIERAKYIRPRKIQRSVIPLILDGFGKYNLKVSAQTGSGKTCAFLLPIVEECITAKMERTFSTEPYTPFAVILEPVRELASQVYDQARKLCAETGVIVAKAYGEYCVKKNVKELLGGCDILCVTPGRFNHFVREKHIKLNKVRFLVFDEGDRLLTDEFNKTIHEALFGYEIKIANTRQTLFFSATFNAPLLQLAEKYMTSRNIVTIKSSNTAPTKKVTQEFRVQRGYKFAGVRNCFVEELEKVGGDTTKLPRTFVFCKAGDYCEKLAIALKERHQIPAIPMSGFRGQDLREKALRQFRDREVAVLVVTDLCSRGIDIKDVDLVINCDMPDPDDYETYVHRVGRAGRIRHGRSISFVDPEIDRPLLLKIKDAMQKCGQIIPPSLQEILGTTTQAPPNVSNEDEASVSHPAISHEDEDQQTEEDEKEEGEVSDTVSDAQAEDGIPLQNEEEEIKPENGGDVDDEDLEEVFADETENVEEME